MERISTRKTTGVAFANWTIELVIEPLHADRLRLLCWTNEKASVARYIEMQQETKSGSETDRHTIIFQPEDLNPIFLRAMKFPSGAVSFGSTQQLLDEIFEVIKRFTDLGNDHALLAAHSVLASWFVDATDRPVSLKLPLQQNGQNGCIDCRELGMERDDEELKRQQELANLDSDTIIADHPDGLE